MTGFWPGLASLVIALSSGYASDIILKLSSSTGRLVAGAAVVIALYCAGLGAFHAISDWTFVDLSGAANEQGMSVAGRRGIALILIQVWPFVMIVVGLAAAFVYGRVFRTLSRRV